MRSIGMPRVPGSSLDAGRGALLACFEDIREATALSPLYAKHVNVISKLIFPIYIMHMPNL